jgi:hypothetical protein
VALPPVPRSSTRRPTRRAARTAPALRG